MNLFESLKKPFIKTPAQPEIKNPSNDPDLQNTVRDISTDAYGGVIGFSDIESIGDLNFNMDVNVFEIQNKIIERYRKIVSNPEVNNAVDIIVNEVIYTPLNEYVFKIDVNEENDKIKEKIYEEFNNIMDLMNINETIFSLVRQAYVDGQLNISLTFDENKLDKGIIKAKVVEPLNLYYDHTNKLWKYKEDEALYLYKKEEDTKRNTFTDDEFIHIDFGLYQKITLKDVGKSYVLNLGYLENAFKYANMLDTLENLLVPYRYSRSVMRRLFNVDVGDLPPKKAKAALQEIKQEFRYKKSYNVEEGTIKNSRNTQPLVEDYWMTNRSGGKGTQVDVMDERGNALDMEDIKHVARKLYNALKIPSSRNPYAEDQTVFSFDNTQVTQEEYNFYIFISRLRIPFTHLVKEVLKRNIIAKKIMTEQEWNKYQEKINISFQSDAIFLENMKKDMFMKSIESFDNMKEQIGKNVSLETALKMAFSWSDEDIKEEFEKIKKEKIDKLYEPYFKGDEEEGGYGGRY